MSSQIVIGAARGIVATLNKEKLKEFGEYIDLNRHWAPSLLHRMNFERPLLRKLNIHLKTLLRRKQNSLMIW